MDGSKFENVDKDNRHVDLECIENYLRHQRYSAGMIDKGEKANFRRACRKFSYISQISPKYP